MKEKTLHETRVIKAQARRRLLILDTDDATPPRKRLDSSSRSRLGVSAGGLSHIGGGVSVSVSARDGDGRKVMKGVRCQDVGRRRVYYTGGCWKHPRSQARYIT